MATGLIDSIQALCIISLAALVAGKVNVIEVDASGTILDLAGQPYYVPFDPVLTVDPSRRSDVPAGFVPVTSITAQYSPITKSFLESQIAAYGNIDDVWTDRFLDSLFISYDGQFTGFFQEEAEEWLQASNISHLYLSSNIRLPKFTSPPVSQIEAGPPAGPYFTMLSLSSSHLDIHAAYRLRKDEYASFLFGAIPDPSGGWIKTNITLDTSNAQYIPVPSRISLLTKSLPLSGMRFALKDIFDVQGLPTGAGSLAYALVNPVPNTTAPSIQYLFSLGATLLGKTRTSQFAHGAQPWEYVDHAYSFNPRADGHLTASASSSGSACAVAGYEWVEFTVGSDTRGSVRKPAAFVGAYGMRPTHGSLYMAGVVPLAEDMDTAGYFARDPRLFSAIGSRWYESSPVRKKRQSIRFPKKLFYPTEHFPVSNPAAQVLYDNFAAALSKHLKITTVPLNFTSSLLDHFPSRNFTEFRLASNTLAEYRSWVTVGKPLIQAYKEKFNSMPTFDPRTRKMFERGAMHRGEDFLAAQRVLRAFSESVSSDLLKADIKSCSDALFMYDASVGGRPSYRIQDYNNIEGAAQALLTGPIDLHGGDAGKPSDYFTYVASMAGLPEITIPLGQVEYYSHVSREWEMLPVAVQVVAHKGCDDMLLSLVEKLAGKEVLEPAKTGRYTF
ncbi:Glutamyl-tRNA(Gln) amidotransferase subunit A [Termitomyces sp. T112]|nr:Glutamyl-tRNA(Gln) amidotransferase subunit A [Termitomyces sp. T112]